MEKEIKYGYVPVGSQEFSYKDSAGRIHKLQSILTIVSLGGTGTQKCHIIIDDHCYQVFMTVTEDNSDAEPYTHIFKELYQALVSLGEPK